MYFGSQALPFRAVALETLSQSVLLGLQVLIQEDLGYICQPHVRVWDNLGPLKWPRMLALSQLIPTYGLY